MSYEYLVASLPMLFPGDPPPFGLETFLHRCAGVLSAADEAALHRVLAGEIRGEDPAPAQAWSALETQMRNATATARAAAWQTDPRPHLRPHPGFDGTVRHVVDDAFSKTSPLERERTLDRGRWRLLEDLALRDPFGFAAVIAYGLKLRIAERWAAWGEKTGREECDRLLDEALEASGERAKADREEPA